jgi:TP901 family phage tail tape measure protein
MSLGGRIEIEVVPDLSNFDGQLRRGLQGTSSAASKAGTAIGVALAAGTAIAAVGFKQAIDLGIEFQNNLNNLQAVSHATDQQMSAVAATAQRLGADLSLPATSAAGAAEAMLELAKGGLTVEQAMTAAKGTLQLAAAAQIDGARAAEIQSAALNSFGLSADQAGHVADVLANSANAASGEITDFAQAMQQVGAVAHQFGISLDDTATALSFFANAGIKGSDAGTLLKTALVSLASPTKPAIAAMKTLGLTAFDATGKFVGLESVFAQLHGASQRLTPEMYAQAAATVFGTDAVRLAGVAAGVTAEDWDKMSAAVSKAGGAQEVAAAKMKGLGGALQGLNSQIETAQLQVFDAFSKPLEQAVRAATELVPRIGAGIASGIRVVVAVGETVGPQLAAGIAAGAGAVVGAAQSLLGPFVDSIVTGLGIALQTGISLVTSYIAVLSNVVAFLTPIATGLGQVADAAVRGDGALSAVGAAFAFVGSAAAVVSGVLGPIGAVVGGLVSGFASLPGPIQTVVLAMLALRFAGPLLAGLGSAFRGVTQNTGIFGRALAGVTAPVRAFGAGVQQVRTGADQVNGSFGRLSSGFVSLGRGMASSVVAARNFGQAMSVQRSLAATAGQSLTTLGAAQAAFRTSTLGSVTAVRSFGEQVTAIRAGAAASGQSIGAFAASMRAIGERVPVITQMGAAFQSASSNVTRFGTAAGVAAAAATGLRGIGAGIIGALGGPFGAAITGAIVVLGLFAAANQRSQAEVAAHQASVNSLTEALKASQGAFNQSATEALVSSDEFKQAAASTAQFGISLTDLRDAAINGGAGLEAYRAKLQAVLDANTLVFNTENGPETHLTATGQAAQKALADLNQLAGGVQEARQSYEQFNEAAGKTGASLVNGAEAGKGLQAAIQTLGDAAASTDQKISALKRALDDLSGGQVSAEEAVARTNETVERLGAAFTEAGKAAGGAKGGFIDASGAINTTTAAGRTLLTQTTDLRDRMAEEAQAAFTAAGGFGNLGPATQAASTAAQRAHGAFIQAATAAGIGATEAEALAARYGLIPSNVVTLITAQGLDQVGQELLQIKARFDAVPNQKSIVVESLSDPAKAKLEALGLTVKTLPNGKVEVTAEDAQARAKLAAFLAFAAGQISIVKIDANPDPATGKINATVQLGNGQTATMTLDANPSPADGKIHGVVDLGNGSTATITLDGNPDPATGQINATIDYGNGQTSTVKVDANVSQANSAISGLISRWNGFTIHGSAVISSRIGGLAAGGIVQKMDKGSVLGFANGGQARLPKRRMTPMRGGIASIVPPRTMRLIGDRMKDDEAYIPINHSARSRRIFEETARRMGYAVARRFADGGVAHHRAVAVTRSSQMDLDPVVRELRAGNAISRALRGDVDQSGPLGALLGEIRGLRRDLASVRHSSAAVTAQVARTTAELGAF